MDNGNDRKRADLVTAMRSFADGEGVDHPTLTRFMKSLAETLGKAEMATQAEDIARGMRLAGVETWGDMRVVDRQVLVDNGGMRPLDAMQYLALVAEAKRDEEQGEPADGGSLGSRDWATEPEAGLEDEDEEILVVSQVKRLEQPQRE